MFWLTSFPHSPSNKICLFFFRRVKWGLTKLEDAKPIQEAPIHDYSPNHSTVGKRKISMRKKHFRLTHTVGMWISPFKSEWLDYLNNDVFWRTSSLSYKQTPPWCNHPQYGGDRAKSHQWNHMVNMSHRLVIGKRFIGFSWSLTSFKKMLSLTAELIAFKCKYKPIKNTIKSISCSKWDSEICCLGGL